MDGILSTTLFEEFSNDSDVSTESMTALSNVTKSPRMLMGEYIDAVYNVGKFLPLFQGGVVFEILTFYVLPPLALICNSLTLITMSRLKPFTSCSLYICSLAIGDTLVLVLRMLDKLVNKLDLDVGSYGCSFINFIIYVTLHGSIWTIVVLTFERFVAVIFPLKVNSMFTMKRTRISIVLVYLIFTLIDAHIIYTYDMVVSPAKWIGIFCSVRRGTELWSRNIWFWINTMLFAVIPCSILLFLNVIIILGMKASNKKQKTMVVNDSNKSNAQQKQLTIMLLVMSFSYIIFFVPVCIFQILAIGYFPFESPEFFATFHFTFSFVFLFASLNHAVNFVFYFASNRRFRNALYQVICCKEVGEKKRYLPKGTSSGVTVETISSRVPSEDTGPPGPVNTSPPENPSQG